MRVNGENWTPNIKVTIYLFIYLFIAAENSS